MKLVLRTIALTIFALLMVILPVAAQTPAPALVPVTEPGSASASISGGQAPPASANDANIPVLHVNVKLVNVFTNVTDATGAIVGGLSKEDFAVTEDGRPERIAIFERQSELPLSLVLAIDTSGSVRKDLPLEQDAARKFVHALLRGQDQMSLLEFSTEVRQVVGFTNQASKMDHGLASLRGGPATALYDAIYLASQNLAPKQGRKVLVLVTDGGDTANTVTYAQALEQALRGEVMVYSIIDVPIEASAGRDTGGEHALITLAEQTGGKYFYASAGGLDKAFAQVSEDLRTQYLLGYYPANQPPGLSFHRIHVTVPRAAEEAFEIRYRTGYYSDSQAGKE
jgi:Ca-activated chloride channel homolog